MHKHFVSGLLIGAVATLMLAALFLGYMPTVTFLAAVQAAGSIAVAFSAITAYRLYRANLERHAQEDRRATSEKFLDESVTLLSRSYETFTRLGETPPKNDRLLWLSTARMIIRFQRMREKITESDHQAIADEHEEYVRLKFYTVLEGSKDQLTLDYFLPDGDRYSAESIARASVAVIFDFSGWREGMEDPMSTVDDKELFAKGAVPIDFLGVESFLSQYQDYWEKIQQRKAERREESA
jgi:hypothetical protein